MSEAKSQLIALLLQVADRYCTVTGQSQAGVASRIFGRSGHFRALAEGRRDLTTGIFAQAVGWFDANWPAGQRCPADLARLRDLVDTHEADGAAPEKACAGPRSGRDAGFSSGAATARKGLTNA